LVNDTTVLSQTAAAGVSYIHIGFDKHQIITANGAKTESLHAGEVSKQHMDLQAREELFTLFPTLRTQPNDWGAPVRPCLKVQESKLLAG
jgi:hypothetical protein